MESELTIRLAQPGDRPAMERICAHTWEDGDYIPEVWDLWLADQQGGLIVGEMGRQVVALSKITFQPAGQVWLEGMRVDPDYRRQGIAGQFLRYSLDHVRQRGARVVRLGTSGNNKAVHKLAARTGMVHIASYVFWKADPLPGGSSPILLTPERASQVHAFLRESPILAHTHGLYHMHWVWQELSTEGALHFLDTGRMVGHLGTDESLLALAIVDREEQDDALWMGYVDGSPSALTELAMAIRAHAAQVGAKKVETMVPDMDWLRNALQAAGYGFGDWESELWIFERWLSPAHGDGHDS
jgi:GNAT superfamily N-acetyltransferase